TEQFKKIRSDQLDTITNLVSENKSICCGDFNIRHKIKHNAILELPLSDTYFSNRFNHKNSYTAPYDRVIYNSSIRCKFISYLGNTQYSDIGYCSDHNGVLF